MRLSWGATGWGSRASGAGASGGSALGGAAPLLGPALDPGLVPDLGLGPAVRVAGVRASPALRVVGWVGGGDLNMVSQVWAGGNGSRQISLRPEWSNRCDWAYK